MNINLTIPDQCVIPLIIAVYILTVLIAWRILAEFWLRTGSPIEDAVGDTWLIAVFWPMVVAVFGTVGVIYFLCRYTVFLGFGKKNNE